MKSKNFLKVLSLSTIILAISVLNLNPCATAMVYEPEVMDQKKFERQMEMLAVEEAVDGVRRIYHEGEVLDMTLVPPGEFDASGTVFVIYEEISTTGWVTQYVDSDGDRVCDYSIVWQPVVLSSYSDCNVYFMLTDVGGCPEGGAL
jgi:hypothetical protein